VRFVTRQLLKTASDFDVPQLGIMGGDVDEGVSIDPAK
jgi:hypothetical protein